MSIKSKRTKKKMPNKSKNLRKYVNEDDAQESKHLMIYFKIIFFKIISSTIFVKIITEKVEKLSEIKL